MTWTDGVPVVVCPACGVRRSLSLAAPGSSSEHASNGTEPLEHSGATEPPALEGLRDASDPPTSATHRAAPALVSLESADAHQAPAPALLSLSLPARLASAPPRDDLPPVLCPKCGNRQHADRACDRCGLVFATVREGREPWLRLLPGQAPALERAEVLWGRVAQSDLDPALHDAFVAHCLESDLVDHGVRVYRMTLGSYPGHPELQRGLERLTESAHMRVLALRPSRDAQADKRRASARLIAMGVALVLVVFGIMIAARMVRNVYGAIELF